LKLNLRQIAQTIPETTTACGNKLRLAYGNVLLWQSLLRVLKDRRSFCGIQVESYVSLSAPRFNR